MFISLRARICIAICAALTAAVVAGAMAFLYFSRQQLLDERENCLLLARQFASTLNHVLATSSDPQKTLSDFVSYMDRLSPGTIGYVPGNRPPAMDKVRLVAKGVPQWFIDHMFTAPSAVDEQFPVLLNGRKIGDLVVMPDSSAEIYEKWITFLVLISSALILALLISALVYFILGAAFSSIFRLSHGLARLRAGDYHTRPHTDEPHEFQKGFEALNELADTLRGLQEEKQHLLRRMVSLQDDERNELSRELHDESGPLLFAIRANTGATRSTDPKADNTDALQRVAEAAEALQQVHRRILERLRPMHLKELGLTQSVIGLLRGMELQSKPISHSLKIDPAIERVDETTARTIYRVVQEGLTNVMRHARASHVNVVIGWTSSGVRVLVSDNGAGFVEPLQLGRGLTGMRERVRALGGQLFIQRDGDHTILNAAIPSLTGR